MSYYTLCLLCSPGCVICCVTPAARWICCGRAREDLRRLSTSKWDSYDHMRPSCIVIEHMRPLLLPRRPHYRLVNLPIPPTTCLLGCFFWPDGQWRIISLIVRTPPDMKTQYFLDASCSTGIRTLPMLSAAGRLATSFAVVEHEYLCDLTQHPWASAP